MAEIIERIPPQAIDAEQAVLASMLVDRNIIPLVRPKLTASAFYDRRNGRIFTSIVRLYEDGSPVDCITVRDALGQEAMAECGGFNYLIDLVSSIPTTSFAEHYADIVADKARLRRVIEAASEAIDAAFAPGIAADEVANDLTSRLNTLSLASTKGPTWEPGWYANAVEARADAGRSGNLETGIYDLDQQMTMTAGDLVIIAGRPAMGKTAFTLALAWGVAQYAPVLFYSLEMARDRLMDRLTLSLHSGMDSRALERGALTEEQWGMVHAAEATVFESGLRLDGAETLAVEDVRRGALKMQAEGKKPAMIVIDYLGLMKLPNADRHDLKLGMVTRALKKLARELGCVVVLLSQLNRGVESRQNKRPMLGDLKDSGNIEADADKVLLLYRDDYYAHLENRESDKPGTCEVNLAKHRSGEVGIIDLYFNRERQRFECPNYQAWAVS